MRISAFCICENKDTDQFWGNHKVDQRLCLYPPQTVFVGGYTVFTLSDRPTVRVSVTFCFLNNFKNH